MKVKVKKMEELAHIPQRAYKYDAGADLFSIEEVSINPHSPCKVRTGLSVALPHKTCGIIWGRSSVESRGLIVTAGLIDEGYRGEIIVCMFNLTDKIQVIGKGQKIAQLVILPVYYPNFKIVKELPKSNRGENGFGSSGDKKEQVKIASTELDF